MLNMFFFFVSERCVEPKMVRRPNQKAIHSAICKRIRKTAVTAKGNSRIANLINLLHVTALAQHSTPFSACHYNFFFFKEMPLLFMPHSIGVDSNYHHQSSSRLVVSACPPLLPFSCCPKDEKEGRFHFASAKTTRSPLLHFLCLSC